MPLSIYIILNFGLVFVKNTAHLTGQQMSGRINMINKNDNLVSENPNRYRDRNRLKLIF